MGKRGRPEDFRTEAAALAACGAEVASIPRGGETTYHGPGQLVLYPILNLREASGVIEGFRGALVPSTCGIPPVTSAPYLAGGLRCVQTST